jgi:N-carbamoylputrescine amidase
MPTIQIACIQLASQPFDPGANLEKATSLITRAAEEGASIVLLPEVFNPGYSLVDKSYAHTEPIDGITVSRMCELASRLGVFIAGGLGERAGGEFYNAMFFVGPSGLLGHYRKRFVTSLENKYWKRGDAGLVIETKFGAIGLGICADMQHPEMWREYAGKVDLVLICSAWGRPEKYTATAYARSEERQCKELPVQISRVLRVPVAYCNAAHECEGNLPLVGRMYCLGHSKITDGGKVVAALDSSDEAILHGTVETREKREEVDMNAFRPWVRHSLMERLTSFFVDYIGAWHGRAYYARHKRVVKSIRPGRGMINLP